MSHLREKPPTKETESMNIDERLREILEGPFTNGWHNTIDAKMNKIKALVRESLPEERECADAAWEQGYFDCRNEMLAKWSE